MTFLAEENPGKMSNLYKTRHLKVTNGLQGSPTSPSRDIASRVHDGPNRGPSGCVSDNLGSSVVLSSFSLVLLNILVIVVEFWWFTMTPDGW